jgi:type I restriction enzyme, S subunit
MIDGLKPYPSYRDSGVPWLGNVPLHWDVLPNRALFIERRERDHPTAEMLSVTIQQGIIRQKSLLADGSMKDSSKLDKSAYKLVVPGDLAYNKMRAWQGAVGASAFLGIVSPAYVVQRPRAGLNPRYYHYLFRTPAFAREAERWSYGITSDMWSLRPEHFKLICSCVPPPEEQAALVRFLDHADRQIRRTIRAKWKLIALLDEQKQVIIHQAVTRGLDPGVQLKPSGVEWLGDVPEHWEVDRLKHYVFSVTSGSRGWSNFSGDKGPLFIRIGNLRRESLGLDLTEFVRLCLPPEALSEAERTRVLPGDLLLSITAFIGSVAVVPDHIGEAYVSQHVACCRPRHGAVNVRWLGYVLLSPVGQHHGRLCMYGGTKQGLSLDDVKNHVVLLPSIKEQSAIVAHIEDSVAKLEDAHQAIEREIQFLLQLRTRLISDVVTGKLDVREAASQLPSNEVAEDIIDDSEIGAEEADVMEDADPAEVEA